MRRPKKKVYDYKKVLRDNEKQKKSTHKKDEISPKEEVKEIFFSWFRKRAKVGQVMSKQDVVTNVLKRLDMKQNKVLDVAMNELKTDRFFDVKEDGVTLVLTQKGIDFLSSSQ